jgi:hypothetical protein
MDILDVDAGVLERLVRSDEENFHTLRILTNKFIDTGAMNNHVRFSESL